MSHINYVFFKLANERDSELEACEYLDAFAKKCDFIPESLDEVRLAFIEGIINAKEHAPKNTPNGQQSEIFVDLSYDQENLQVRIRDFGQGFDPGQVEKPDIKKKLKSANKRGWGLMLMEKLMDGVEITSFPPSGTLITMVKKRLKIEPLANTDTVREQKRIERLKYILGSFIDLSSFLCQNKNLETGLRSMLRILLGTLGVTRGAIYINDHDSGSSNCLVDIKLKAKDRFPAIRLSPEMQLEFFRQETLEVSELLKKHVPELFQSFSKEELDKVYILKSDSDALGLLVLGTRFKENDGDTADEDLLTTLSRNISSAINTFQLMQKLKEANTSLDQRFNELNAVREASQSISSELEIENLPYTIERIFKSIIDVRKVSIALFDPAENRFSICQTGRDLPTSLDLWSSPISRHVTQKLEPLFVTDIDKEKRFNFPRRSCYLTNSFLVIPVTVQDQILGIISLTDKANDAPLTERDFEMAKLLACHVAIALKNANLYKLGITDSLTKLYTNHYFKTRLAQEISRQRRVKSFLSGIFMDIDQLDRINHEFGYEIGDQALVKAAGVIRKQIRFNDIPCRYGGDNFALILPDTSAEGAAVVAEKLRSNIEALEIFHAGQKIGVTASFGVAQFDFNNDLTEFVETIEVELDKAGKNGGNKVYCKPHGSKRGSEGSP